MCSDSNNPSAPAPVPPDILDYPTSQDMVVLEGTNVTLTCAATGVPEPTVNWKREGDKSITSVEDSGSMYYSFRLAGAHPPTPNVVPVPLIIT